MLIRVLEIPAPTGDFHFGGGQPQTFVEVDWFMDAPEAGMPEVPSITTDEGQAQIIEFVKGKRYFDPSKAYLILHPTHPLVINYDPDTMIRERENRRRG